MSVFHPEVGKITFVEMTVPAVEIYIIMSHKNVVLISGNRTANLKQKIH
jgi:hypothetical protein